jgi:TPR repeat protein
MIHFDAAGVMPVANAQAPISAEAMFELGMMHSSGRETPADLVMAHMWFNLAAMKGNAEAVRLRREVAAEMLDAEIGRAQRAARDWLRSHPEAAAPEAPGLRAAA